MKEAFRAILQVLGIIAIVLIGIYISKHYINAVVDSDLPTWFKIFLLR